MEKADGTWSVPDHYDGAHIAYGTDGIEILRKTYKACP